MNGKSGKSAIVLNAGCGGKRMSARDNSGSAAADRGRRGYTLLEVLVAMVLVAVVTLVATLALRLAMQAWQRARTEGEAGIISVTLPLLLQRQLAGLQTRAEFAVDGKTRQVALPFRGDRQRLSFYTSYVTQGIGGGGLRHVVYLFREEEQSLWIYLEPVTRREQVVTGGTVPENLDDQEPVSRLAGLKSLAFSYRRPGNEEWREESRAVPEAVQVEWQRAGKKTADRWVFAPGSGGR